MKTSSASPLFVLLVAASIGCGAYTSYLYLDPATRTDRPALEASDRKEAIAIVERVSLKLGLVANPEIARLQRQSTSDVDSQYRVEVSFVPPESLTSNRLTVSAIVYNASERFAG